MNSEFFRILMVAMLMLVFAPVVDAAQNNTSGQTIEIDDAGQLKVDIVQPYVVKKGDTLWDIANYFFQDPHTWMKIWENNLYISNPDLIYPGNKIWFSVKEQEKTGGLTTIPTIRPEPTLLVKEVERSEPPIDTSLYVTALERQDFIDSNGVEGIGYIVGSENERLNFGADDKLYLKLSQPAKSGDMLDIFRTSGEIVDPESGDVVGVLVEHHGQLKVLSRSDDVYRATVTRSFAEIMRGDRLKPAKHINPRIEPVYPAYVKQGKVLYIQDDGVEAGQHQNNGISLGIVDGMTPGTVLSVHRKGRVIQDKVTHDDLQLPEEKIGEIMVLVPQKNASLAMISASLTSIHLGDIIRNQASH